MMPSDWDPKHPKGLLPKEILDLQDKEFCDVVANKKALEDLNNADKDKDKKNTNVTKPTVVTDIPPRPEDNVPKIKLVNPDGSLKPITNAEELAALMGTDPACLGKVIVEHASS